MSKNIVIIGGGTAGWFTALYANKVLPEYNITLVESEKVGILGAGEASTTILVKFLDFLNIPVSEIIKNTGATIKNTAKFTNWSKEKDDYFYHPFHYGDSNSNISEFKGYFPHLGINTNIFHLFAYHKNYSMNDYCMINKLCNNNLVPFLKVDNNENQNPILNYYQAGGWSLNFDASMLAKYLRKVAEQRGVNRIEGLVKDISLDDKQNISSITIDNDLKIETSFVFDCTGFARVFIGKKYNSQWISYKQYLPTNKAIPFFLDIDQDKEIPPYIEAIAMDYGWMWRTPLQHRYGCGYVFDNSFISEDQAKDEVEKKLGFEITIPKTFSFEPGCYKEIWIKNCLAVGLSAGFVEPLEATSLLQTIRTLQYFFANRNNIFTEDLSIKKRFNEMYEKESFSIVEYIYWHYVTNKDNTSFWKDFTKNTKVPEIIQDSLNIIKERTLDVDDFSSSSQVFDIDDFLYVLYGHKLISKKIVNRYEKDLMGFEDIYNDLVINQNNIRPFLSGHRRFLKDLSEN